MPTTVPDGSVDEHPPGEPLTGPTQGQAGPADGARGPPGPVTSTVAVPAWCWGATTSMAVGVTLMTRPGSPGPKSTAVASVKSVPWTTTLAPPDVGPEV